MSLSRLALLALLGLWCLVASGCKAGPSAFDRSGGSADSAAIVASVADSLTTPPVDEAIPATEDVVAQVDTAPMVEGAPAADPVDSSIVASESAQDTVRAPNLRFQKPDAVRGIYLNAWASGSRNRVGALLELARRTEVNSFVIDIKDATGYISHPTDLELAAEIGATEEVRIRNLPALLDTLEAEGIYPIARIVIVKDPLLAAARPELAIQDTASGTWIDSKGIVWLNMYDPAVWEYHVDLAKEVAELGFPEIQWDYVRFPDAPASDLGRAVYPGAGERTREEALRAFFEYSREELAPYGVEVTADVFGVTTSFSRDVGIGQVWESFIDRVDVALPMVYPSHYWQGSFGVDTPNAYPYEIVRAALRDAVRRSARVTGAGDTRPWLQDFSLGAPRYEAPEVRAQIQATYDVGIDEWILWNPGSRYTEGALEPIGGFASDPMIRVAGQILPASERWTVVEPVALSAQTPNPAASDSVLTPDEAVPIDPPEPPDTTIARDTIARPDTTGRPPVDTLGAGRRR